MTTPRTPKQLIEWIRIALPPVMNLREGQAEVVLKLLHGRRFVFVAPTGHGKSLCYQALARSPWTPGVVLVFQPLKALMSEQAERARRLGIRADYVNSSQDQEQQRAVLTAAARGELDLLFLSPERLDNDLFGAFVSKMLVKGVVIDEAHCISQWGHDFRPAYRRLIRIVTGLGLRTPVLAMTATAPGRVIDDVQQQIAPSGDPVDVLRLPSYRPNIACEVVEVEGLAGRLAALLTLARIRADEPGIAYTLTTSDAESAAGYLARNRVPAIAYYAKGLADDDRRSRLDHWLTGKATVICATSALGMGMDRADVRWIAHLGLPTSLVQYVQEIGRAGRDGQPATAVAFQDPSTEGVQDALLLSFPDPDDYVRVGEHLRLCPATRTEMERALDIPARTLQSILDDLVARRLCIRQGTPYRYSWTGGGRPAQPEGHEEAVRVKADMLEQVRAFPRDGHCRSMTLSAAMGDVVSPPPCGQCDRCRGPSLVVPATEVQRARDHLTQRRPRIPAHKGVLKEGRALAWHRVGTLGEVIADAKVSRRPVPDSVVESALGVITDPHGPYSGVTSVAVVSLPSTRSGDFVGDFARRLARRLGIPHFGMVKTRETDQQKDFRAGVNKRANVAGAFAIPGGAHIPPGPLLVVDDVYDSGASMLEAARTLPPGPNYPLALTRTLHSDDL